MRARACVCVSRSQADVRDRTHPSRGPLHGVPILVKDNVASDDLGASAGSLALLGAKPKRENGAVTRLRDAGAVILGTSNMSEWANFRSMTGEDDGWSARGGQNYGAYADKMDPCGSSSGSAVAVDLGLCVLAIGTEVSRGGRDRPTCSRSLSPLPSPTRSSPLPPGGPTTGRLTTERSS